MKDLIQVEVVSDASACFEIRKTVFIEEQKVPAQLELDEFDVKATHYLAHYDGNIAGCARTRLTDEGLKVERVAVLKEYRSFGIAKEIMISIEKDAMSKKVEQIILNAQESVIGFYEKLRYEGVGEKFVEAGIVHLKMKKTPQFWRSILSLLHFLKFNKVNKHIG